MARITIIRNTINKKRSENNFYSLFFLNDPLQSNLENYNVEADSVSKLFAFVKDH